MAEFLTKTLAEWSSGLTYEDRDDLSRTARKSVEEMALR